MDVYKILKQRGFIQQMTHESEMADLLREGKVVFYNGYDPTADSLHIGHYLTFMAMSWLQKAGHVPIVLMGGGTGMVGDPDKADKMRPLMDIEQIDHNVERFKAQARKFVDLSEGKAILANNADWLRKLNYADFIREYGIHFSVNRMLAADKYKTKFEGSGLSFFELNYVVMQAYDFLELSRRYGCVMQTGGSDQWSNIVAGVDLIRRIDNKPAYGMTYTLLTTSTGEKMGKTIGGAVWLDAEKTSPYDFYQYWRNVEDADVRNCLCLLTFLPMERINELSALEGRAINDAKEVLAFEVTKLIHGEEEAEKAQNAARALFDKNGASGAGDIPTVEMSKSDFKNNGMALFELLEKAGLAPTRSEARRLIKQGGITVAGNKVTEEAFSVGVEAFEDGELMIQKGKKVHKRIRLV